MDDDAEPPRKLRRSARRKIAVSDSPPSEVSDSDVGGPTADGSGYGSTKVSNSVKVLAGKRKDINGGKRPAKGLLLRGRSSPRSRSSANINCLPVEIKINIICFVAFGSQSLLPCAQLNKSWKALTIPIMHRRFYCNSVVPRVTLPQLGKNGAEFARVSLVALAALRSGRMESLGAPRLFWVRSSVRLEQVAVEHPNPADPAWEELLDCTMDFRETFCDLVEYGAEGLEGGGSPDLMEEDNTTPQHTVFPRGQPWQLGNDPSVSSTDANDPMDVDGPMAPAESEDDGRADRENEVVRVGLENGRLAKGQDSVLMLLRYSEKMDIGSFLLYVELSNRRGAVLLRIKPTDDGRVVMWDSTVYGTCEKCRTRLSRVQVCADW
ncbi:hypothetical protein HK104_002618 [Borealophlyctis nickersoniae]|nr:hypothetical protein HK104_002618 [Borealophlyctis nickersoniae]